MSEKILKKTGPKKCLVKEIAPHPGEPVEIKLFR